MSTQAQPDDSLPANANPRRRARWLVYAGLLAIVACAAGVRARLAPIPLERDEGEYAYMGQAILRGELPYVDAYNFKLPGVYYTYALILSIFGQTHVGVHHGLIVINAATIVLLFLLVRRLMSPAEGLIAAAAFAFLSLSLPALGFTANAEHFVILPAVAGSLLLLIGSQEDRSGVLLWSGFLFGLGFLMKQHGAAFMAFGGLYLLLHNLIQRRGWIRTFGQCVLFSAAAVAPYAITCLYMALMGAFDEFWFWTFQQARDYTGLIDFETGMTSLAYQVGSIGGASIALWLLALLGLTALAWDRPARRKSLFVGLFTLFSFAAICPGLMFREHYFILLFPAACVLVAIACGALGRLAREIQPSWVAPGITAATAALGVATAVFQQADYLFWQEPNVICRQSYPFNPFVQSLKIAEYIREHSGQDDRVAVLGSEPQILFYSNRRSATGFIMVYPMTEPHSYSLDLQQQMIVQIEKTRPEFVVSVTIPTSWCFYEGAPRRIIDWMNPYLREHYDVVGVADLVSADYTAYRWGEDTRSYRTQPGGFYVFTHRRKTQSPATPNAPTTTGNGE